MILVVLFAIKKTSYDLLLYNTSPEVQLNIRFTSINYSRLPLLLQEFSYRYILKLYSCPQPLLDGAYKTRNLIETDIAKLRFKSEMAILT